MVSNPFRSNKWRHRSITVELKDENKEQTDPSQKNPTSTWNADSLLEGIGNYTFESTLGSGRFSNVRLARHYLTGERVAIKIMNKKRHVYRIMSRLVREVNIMEVMNHPNIVRLYETYETADSLYLILEYVQGENLDTYLKSRPQQKLNEKEARVIFRQIVKAVYYCHSKWAIHRDLKAPNVLLTKDNQVKLIDFGLGNRFGLQRLKTVCGSMLYYSPEIISENTYVGPEVDVWCLGILLYRIVTGEELFSKVKTVRELKKGILGGLYTLPSYLSPDIQNTIKKCLSMNSRDRLCLKTCLLDDPWLNDFGRLENVFEKESNYPQLEYHALQATESYVDSLKSENNERIQQSAHNYKKYYRQDIQLEKESGRKVPKHIIYHMLHPATYFTGPVPHSYASPIDLEGQTQAIVEMNDQLILTLNQLKIIPYHQDTLSISSFLRKFKKRDQTLRKTASTFHLLSQKDQIYHYKMQCQIRTDPSTTLISDYSATSTLDDLRPKQIEGAHMQRTLSRRISNIFHLPTQPTSPGAEQVSFEMIKVIRLACEALGINFYQSSTSRLVCLLSLKSSTKQAIPKPYSNTASSSSLWRSRLFSSNDRLSELNKQCPNPSSILSANGSNFGDPVTWHWKIQKQGSRLSIPMLKQSAGWNASTGNLSNSSYQLLSLGRLTQQQELTSVLAQSRASGRSTAVVVSDEPEGYAMFEIETSRSLAHPNSNRPDHFQIVTVKYTRIKGDSKVFKIAKSWIQTLLAQHGEECEKSS